MKKIWLKRTLKSLLLGSSLIPLGFTISCSNEQQYTSEQTSILESALENNYIVINYRNKKADLKINDFNNDFFSYKINSEIEKQENLYENIKNAFDVSSIKFVDYVLPKLNDDNNTYLIFAINDSTKYIYKKISDIKIDDKKINLTNLVEDEIVNELESKIFNNKNYVENINNIMKFVSKKFHEYNKNQNSTFAQFWNANPNIVNEIEQEFLNYFKKNYLTFSLETYQNLFISNISFNEELLGDMTRVFIKANISTINPLEVKKFYRIEKEIVLWI